MTTCSKCKEEKPDESFVNKFGKNCKKCEECREKSKESRNKNAVSRALYQKYHQEKKKDNTEIDVYYARKANTDDQWQRFESRTDMVKELNLYNPNISKVLKRELKTTGGYEIKIEKAIYKAKMNDWEKVKEEHNIVDKCKGQPSQHRIQHEIIDNVIGKKCCRCKEWRPLTEYNNSSTNWDKLRVDCKICLQQQRQDNKERMTEYNKQYWQKTMDVQKEKSKQWRENNPERVKENMKRWSEKNADTKKERDRKYREANWEQVKQRVNIWKKKNYQDMKTNPARINELAEHKIKYNTSRRIRSILGQHKSERSMDYVGCHLKKFRIHLETKFADGMHWKNYGVSVDGNQKYVWHIDHIIPCNAFNLTNPIEQLACFHYKNLQPLWWDDNITKQASFDPVRKQIYLQRFIETYIVP